MANEVCTSLGLIDKDLSGKLIQIVEEHGSNANFMINSLMWNASRSEASICLMAFHYSKNHYLHVAKKLGFNIKMALENNKAIVFEPFTRYVDKKKFLSETNLTIEETVRKMFLDVSKALDSMGGKKCLIIDDLSDLLCLGANVNLAVAFLQYFRCLQNTHKDLALIVCSHRSNEDEDQKLLAAAITHISSYRMTIAALKTGYSTNVTGSVDVVDNLEEQCCTKSNHRLFHFKLTDRQIKVFFPGTVGIQI